MNIFYKLIQKMKTYKILVLALLLGMGSTVAVKAQSEQNEESHRTGQRLSVCQLEQMQCDYISSQLKLDEDMTLRFSTLYMNYLNAIKDCAMKYQKSMVKYSKQTDIPTHQTPNSYLTDLCKKRELLEIQENYYYKFREFLSAKDIQKVYML